MKKRGGKSGLEKKDDESDIDLEMASKMLPDDFEPAWAADSELSDNDSDDNDNAPDSDEESKDDDDDDTAFESKEDSGDVIEAKSSPIEQYENLESIHLVSLIDKEGGTKHFIPLYSVFSEGKQDKPVRENKLVKQRMLKLGKLIFPAEYKITVVFDTILAAERSATERVDFILGSLTNPMYGILGRKKRPRFYKHQKVLTWIGAKNCGGCLWFILDTKGNLKILCAQLATGRKRLERLKKTQDEKMTISFIIDQAKKHVATTATF